MIIRGPEQPNQPAIAQLFAELLADGNQNVLPPYVVSQRDPSLLIQTLYTSMKSNNDLHRFGFTRGQAVVYGFLSSRGDTLQAPQLSLAVHPSFRHRGFARSMASQLHDLARIRGATSIRVTIPRENNYAIALCRSFGYQILVTTKTHLHGSLRLANARDVPSRSVA